MTEGMIPIPHGRYKLRLLDVTLTNLPYPGVTRIEFCWVVLNAYGEDTEDLIFTYLFNPDARMPCYQQMGEH